MQASMRRFVDFCDGVARERRALRLLLAGLVRLWAAAQAAPAPDAPIRFGILPLGGAFESRSDWDPLLAELSRAINRPVSVLSVTSYEALEHAIQRDEVDMAFLSGKMALDAVTQRRMKVVAQVVRHDGLPGYRALLLSRKAPPFNSLKNMLDRARALAAGARREAVGVGLHRAPAAALPAEPHRDGDALSQRDRGHPPGQRAGRG